MNWRTSLVIACAAVLVACSMTVKTPERSIFPAIAETNTGQFRKDVLDAPTPVLVDFYATWCNPCKRMDPVIREVAQKFRGKVRIVRVNIDTNPALATTYRVHAIPRLLLFKNGDIVDDMLGASDAERLSSALKNQLI